MVITSLVILAQLVCHPCPQPLVGGRSVGKEASVAEPPKVNNLTLEVKTRNRRGAGTDNAVYFDVGPWAWRLNKPWRNDFERGNTETFDLKVPEGFGVIDILWLRLHKKGLFGVTGTRDGLTGAWHPQKITLFVNGVEYKHTDNVQRLNSRYWFFKGSQTLNPYSDPASFVRSLRLKPNDSLNWLAKTTGFFTTPLFKKKGISGWINCPEQKEKGGDPSCSQVPKIVCATGTVFRKPAVSNDGFATIDLIVNALEFCSDTHDCHQRAVISGPRPRYLRIEYRHKKNPIPQKDRRIRICGGLLWDTDREGWWEIHPRGPNDVGVLN